MGPSNNVARSSGFDAANNSDFNNIGFSDKPSSVVVMSWVAICVAILGAVAFWLFDSSTVNSYKAKQKQKDQAIQNIAMSEFAQVDKKVSGFKAAYDEIKKASADKFVMNEFLTELYKVINTDIQIRNISITSDGKLSIDGVASSYRAVADQMVALQTLPDVRNLQLLSTSMNTTSKGKTEVPFVFSADVDKSTFDQQNTNSASRALDSNSSSGVDVNQPAISNSNVDATGGTNEAQ